MNNTQLRDVELISQESPGALILSSVWNQNFNRLREVINENNETTENNFDKIISRNIPSEALEILGQTEASNVMEQIILISTILNTKANAVDVTDDMKSFYEEITYDKATGTFRFVKRDGSVLVVDTLLEKMPVSAELVSTEDDVFLRITNDDGSYTETPVSDLVSDYNFLDGDVIQCSVTQKDSNFKVYDVSFQIKQNSITEEYLDPNVLRLINETATNIAALVETAKTASSTSATSANQALEYKNSASLSSTEAREASENAIESAIISKSYAVGGTATRPNEEYDNAKYWAEVAKFQAEKAGKGDANFIIGNISPEKENTIWFNTDGEYTGSDVTTQDVLLQVKDSTGSLYILHPKTTVENVEGLQEELDNLEALDYEVVTKEEFDSMEKQEDVLYLIEDDPETQAVIEHIADTDIHVSTEEKEKWNSVEVSAEKFIGVLPVEKGGTGAETAAAALSALGAAASLHEHAADDITSGILSVARGGTGVASIAELLTALGLGDIPKIEVGSFSFFSENKTISVGFTPKLVIVYGRSDSTSYSTNSGENETMICFKTAGRSYNIGITPAYSTSSGKVHTNTNTSYTCVSGGFKIGTSDYAAGSSSSVDFDTGYGVYSYIAFG